MTLLGSVLFTACEKSASPFTAEASPKIDLAQQRDGAEALALGEGEEKDVPADSPLLEKAKSNAGESNCFGKLLWEQSTLVSYGEGVEAIVTPVQNGDESIFLVTVQTAGGEATSFYIKTTPNSIKAEDLNFTIGMYTVNCELLHESYYANGEYTDGFNNMKNVDGIAGTTLERYANNLWDARAKIPCVKEALGCLIGIISGGWIKPCLKLVVCIILEIID